MRAYEIGTQNGVESLQLVERADLAPKPGHVVLRVRSLCLNHRDLLVLNGTYGLRRPPSRIPCSDGVGDVIAVGEGVEGIAIGQRATCAHFTNWIEGAFSPTAFAADLGINLDGWLAEQIMIPATALVKIPAGLTDEQAAPLPAAGVTAWNALVEVGNVGPGDMVLALGTGGVSIFALQIAKLKGARVAITSSSDDKLVLARKLGADFVINYRTTPDWPKALMEATNGVGADIVVETGGFSTLGQSIAATAVNGRIVVIGALGGPPSDGLPNFSSIIGKNLTLKGIAEGSRAMLTALVDAVDTSGMTPVIDRIFPFEGAREAYAYLKSGQHFGKVMIRAE
jgi:NADPH:quinone reductase-like Zn-dependent oxidoreductase